MNVWSEYVKENKPRFLNEMLDLLRIPSISTKSIHKKDMAKCAELVKQRLLDSGCEKAEIIHTDSNPAVYGERIVDLSKPTVLVYGHYDVQPPEPLELWHNNPFDPVIKDGKIYARGASDDKGQFYMHLKALETMINTNSMFINIKFLIEGDEESGSLDLEKMISNNKELLKADVILISDNTFLNMETPSLDTGIRGISYIEVEVTGPNKDLHSGVYGGAVANPVNILAKMIASCHDENNHIIIPGFYDDVLTVSGEERSLINMAPYNEKGYMEELGVEELWGEKGYTTYERTGIRPTLDVNGVWGGYTGEGSKTVLPSKAFAKLSARLVPNQTSAKITEQLEKYFKSIAPRSVKVTVETLGAGEPYMISINSKGYKAASKALEKTFGKAAIPVRSGGSNPICSILNKVLGVDIIFMGFGLDSDNIHSPNEKFNINCYYKGIETIPYFHKYFAEMN